MASKTALKIVETSSVPIDWENREAFIPECPIYPALVLENEWYQRKAERDRRRRPVTPVVIPPKRVTHAQQMEMFASEHVTTWRSDMRFDGFQTKYDPKTETTTGIIKLSVDVADPFSVFADLLKLQDRSVDVLLGETRIRVKNLEN